MAYDDLGFDFVQMLRDALVPPKPDEAMRTCDCPIYFPDDGFDFMRQAHRYNCPVPEASRLLDEEKEQS